MAATVDTPLTISSPYEDLVHVVEALRQQQIENGACQIDTLCRRITYLTAVLDQQANEIAALEAMAPGEPGAYEFSGIYAVVIPVNQATVTIDLDILTAPAWVTDPENIITEFVLNNGDPAEEVRVNSYIKNSDRDWTALLQGVLNNATQTLKLRFFRVIP